MEDLLAARLQMAFSLGFHIIFASIGMAMPFFMAASHWKYLRSKDENYKLLTKTWSKGVAIFFAVGAVSGTALSFELGMLWPGFMEHAGIIIGLPFSLEGAAFFLEAVALGLFLYGWDRLPPRVHWICGLVVGISGLASAYFIICANGWMNTPRGFDWNDGNPINIDPIQAMLNPAALPEALHMIVASFQATGFAVAGLHAFLLLRTKFPIHLQALKIAFCFAAIASIIQPLVGDFAAKSVAKHQPLKLAAMEAHFETEEGAPLIIGGIPDEDSESVSYALKIPKALSFLAYGDLDAEVKGLKDFPKENWPPVMIVHFAFQIMVGIGSLLALIGLLGLFGIWKNKKWIQSRNFLWLLTACIPLGFVAIEAGWIVTEVGRQPWIIYEILKTKDALTPRPGIVYTFYTYLGLYLLLSFVLVFLMQRQIRSLHHQLRSLEK